MKFSRRTFLKGAAASVAALYIPADRLEFGVPKALATARTVPEALRQAAWVPQQWSEAVLREFHVPVLDPYRLTRYDGRVSDFPALNYVTVRAPDIEAARVVARQVLAQRDPARWGGAPLVRPRSWMDDDAESKFGALVAAPIDDIQVMHCGKRDKVSAALKQELHDLVEQLGVT